VIRVLFLLALWLGACQSQPPDPQPPAEPSCDEPLFEQLQFFDHDSLPTRWGLNQGWPGIAVGDFTGDGWPDVLMAYTGGSALLVNDGTGALAVDEGATMDGEPLPRARAAAAVDLDGDGDLDGFLGLYDAADEEIFLWNDGHGRFTSTRLAGSDSIPWGPSFGDLNGDGRVDLYLATYDALHSAEAIISGEEVGRGHAVYLQAPDGTFVREEGAVPEEVDRAVSLQGALLDADLDGDLDVYMANDFGPFVLPNRLLKNDGTGHFTVAEECTCDLSMYAMGAGVGDPDSDGDPDIYISNVGSPRYLQNLGDGTFADSSISSGAWIEPAPENMTSWGVRFFDADQDGCQDAVVVYGRLGANQGADFILNYESGGEWSESDYQADLLMLGDCAGGFTRAPASVFADGRRARAVAVGDLDRDGRPDLVIAGKHYLSTWRNAGGCPPGVRVTLDAGPGNRHGLGAKVQTTVGSHTDTRWMLIDSTASSSEPALYIGLGESERADTIKVTWPDGTVEQHEDVPRGTRLDLVQGEP